ncbi:YfjI family protein [Flindersiella endophytica]
MAEAHSAALAVDSIEIPAKPRLLADDVTPEQAATIMAEQGGRIAVLSAEGGIFAILAGRYSGVANLDLFLKDHAGDTLIVDRRGRHERIDNAALTLGLAVQPQIIADIAGMPGFRGKGLLGRILYSLPPSNVGYRNVEPDPIPAEVAERYLRNVQDLTLTMAGWDDPARLTLTPEAGEVFTEHRRRTEQRLRPGAGDLAHIADWAGKYDGAVARVAGLLHLATDVRNAWRNPIGADTIHAAAKLGDYFTAHALAAFDAMGVDPDLDAARALLDWLKRTRPATFTRRDAHRANHRRFPKAADLDPALTVLEEHGWIRASPTRSRAPTWQTHPDLSDQP